MNSKVMYKFPIQLGCLLLIVILILFGFLCLRTSYVNKTGIFFVILSGNGYELYDALSEYKSNISSNSITATSSTDLFNQMLKSYLNSNNGQYNYFYENIFKCATLRGKSVPARITGVRERTLDFNKSASEPLLEILADENCWTVANNLPENAPDNAIVLATRNIHPECFRVKYDSADKDIPLRFIDDDLLILKHIAIVFYKNGKRDRFVLRQPLSRKRNYTMLDLYGEKSFDMSSSSPNVEYLTPK